MKKLSLFFFLVFTGFILQDCDPGEDVKPKKSKMTFSFSSNSNEGGRINTNDEPFAILVSIKNAAGDYVYQLENRTLYSYGQGNYISESVELAEGDYTVTDFIVLNSDNEVTYLTPQEGAPILAQYPQLNVQPLPVLFTVSEEQGTVVDMDVIPYNVETDESEDFGYASFALNVIDVPDEQLLDLKFVASTNLHLVTEGYDSVKFTFTSSAGRKIVKYLNIISPVEAVGHVSMSELEEYGTWMIQAQAYYESIDVVPNVFHVVESTTTSLVYCDTGTDEIRIHGGNLSTTSSTGEVATTGISWENWSHVHDQLGYFYFRLKNDICEPYLEYKIKRSDAANLLYEKAAYDILGNSVINWNQVNVPSPQIGSYEDSHSFVDICRNIDGPAYGDFFFELTDPNRHNAFISGCWLSWIYEDTPLDPLGNSENIGRYSLQLGEPSTEGGRIGKARPSKRTN